MTKKKPMTETDKPGRYVIGGTAFQIGTEGFGWLNRNQVAQQIDRDIRTTDELRQWLFRCYRRGLVSTDYITDVQSDRAAWRLVDDALARFMDAMGAPGAAYDPAVYKPSEVLEFLNCETARDLSDICSNEAVRCELQESVLGRKLSDAAVTWLHEHWKMLLPEYEYKQGAQRVSDALKSTWNIRISKTTIQNFRRDFSIFK